jgi:predicted ArsR family transcriptional regulator
MTDPFPSVVERRRAILSLLAKRGPLTVPQIQSELGSHRYAVERALGFRWFERLSTGRSSLYGLSAEGREKAAQMDAA